MKSNTLSLNIDERKAQIAMPTRSKWRTIKARARREQGRTYPWSIR